MSAEVVANTPVAGLRAPLGAHIAFDVHAARRDGHQWSTLIGQHGQKGTGGAVASQP